MRSGLPMAFLLALSFSGSAWAQDALRGGDCANVQPQPVVLRGAESFTYKSTLGPEARDLRVHVFQPKGSGIHPAILFFFGGGWRTGALSAFEEQAKAFTAHGYVSILADYRVACRDKTTAVEAVVDAADAYGWLLNHARELNVDRKRLVLSGGSAGGHLALTTAILAPADRKPGALVLFNPAVDIVKIAPAIGLPLDQARPISPSLLPVAGLPPTIIFHGKADRTVPIETTRAFCARMTAANLSCEMVEYVGQDHGFFQSHALDREIGLAPYDDTLAKSLAFVDKRLGPSGPR